MTIKQPSERTGPNGPNKMCGGSLGMFHDYSLPHPAMLDHSLQMDVPACASSPNSLYLYEQDLDVPSSLPSSSDGSHMNDFGQLDELDLKPEVECYDLLNLDMKSIHSTTLEDMSSGRDPVWSPSATGLMKMEDIFQVDHSDAIQGPTLAELNGDQSQSLLDEAENFIGLEELGMGKPCIYPVIDVKPQIPPCSAPCNEPSSIEGLGKSSSFSLFPRADCAKTSCQQTCVQGTPVSHTEDNKGSLQLLLQSQVIPQALGSLGPPRTQPPSATLSRPTNRSNSPGAESIGSDNSMDRKWEEIKQFIHDEPEMFKRKDVPLTTIKVEPEDPAYTPSEQVAERMEDIEEGMSSDSDESNVDVLSDDQDHDDDVFSDAESQDSLMSFTEESPVGAVKKGKRYFWQYNTQSKGPKGKRLCKSVDSNDPHVLNDFKDPVFDPNLNQNQYKHNGKARRGDGNDITPSPQKLFQIGNELKKLNRIINDLTPVSELPVNARSRSRKEKNKLASRACRLKKKAQHEANKVKLFGLHQEHEQLLDMLDQICDEVKLHLEKPPGQSGETMTAKLERMIRDYSYTKVAGNSTKFVNSVLVKVAAGDPKGGLNN